jgi:ABC-type ATPase with predicted acetyltransferase domain
MTMTELYRIDRRFTCRTERTPRMLEIAEAFGIGLEDREFVIFDNLELHIEAGDVIYITGQSGSGKSLLLKALESQMTERGKRVVNLDRVPLDETQPIIEQIGSSTNDAIRLLGAAGINDAYLYARKPSELSDGQRYRFRVAKCLEANVEAIFCDEFLAVLDRVTALTIAFSLQKACRKAGITLVVATTHRDMVNDLAPSLYIEKRFREKVLIRSSASLLEGV